MTRIPPRAVHVSRRSRVIWLIAVAVLGVGFGLMLTRHPRFKSWRATQLADKALASMAAGDTQTATNQAVAAYQLAPKNLTVLRAAARVTSEQGNPQGLIFYRTLAQTNTATGEDYLGFAKIALTLGAIDVFQENIQQAVRLLPPGDLRVEQLLGRYALLNGDHAAAITAFRTIADAKPASAEAKLDLAAALLSSPTDSLRRTAPPLVEEALKLEPGLAAHGLILLAGAGGLPPETRVEALDRLLAMRDLKLADRLEALRQKITLDPADRSRIVDEVAKIAVSGSPGEREAGARWLVQVRENQRAVEILPLEAAAARMDWLLIWLDATAGLGRWSDVQAALDRPDVALPDSVRELFYGRALDAQGKPFAQVHYEKALAAAGNDTERLFYLAGYFNEMGAHKLSIAALNKLTENPDFARTAYQGLIGIYRRMQDTRGLLELLERMYRRWPSDLAVGNDLRYLRLLTGTDIAEAVQSAREVATRNPGVLPFQMTLALGLLRQGRAEEAAGIFEESKIQIAQLLPQQRAIFAAILAATGDRNSAAGVANLTDRSQLLSEEAALIPAAASP